MHTRTKYVAVVAATAVLGLGGASTSASANIVKAGVGGPAFSGLSASGANHMFMFGSAPLLIACTSVSFANVSGAGNMNASFSPGYIGCQATVALNLCKAYVTTTGAWTLTQGATKTGGWGAFLSVGSAAKIEIDGASCSRGPVNCTINIPAQSGLTGSSVLAANDATSTTVTLSGTVSGISWTSATPGCGIGTGAANGAYSMNGTGGITVNGIKLT